MLSSVAQETYPITVERGIRKIGPDRYQVRVFVGRDQTTGKIRHATKTITASGIREARELRARFEANRKDLEGPRMSFGAYLEEWLSFGKKSGWTTKHYSENRRKVERVIGPLLGKKRLDKLDAKALDHFYSSLKNGLDREGLSGKPLAPRTVLGYHRLISSALEQAVKWGHVPRNVAKMATPPKAHKVELEIPTTEEVSQIIIRAERTPRLPEFPTLLRLAAATGARRGELCALRWEDVDLLGEAGITIRHAIGSFAGKTELKDPKSHAIRFVPIGAQMALALEGRYQRASMLAAEVGQTLEDGAFVFSLSPDGSTYLRPDTVTQAFARNLANLEGETERPWPYRFHDLRHYFATHSLAAGASPIEVAKMLGHSDASMVFKVYGHATAPRLREIAESVDSSLF